ncbi:hypothetical protein RFK99_01105 [Streptococcus suis]|uniref:hypothetical protein n=1 Tax=Streptococcus suis TaxID=1307 RepID=UPI002FC5C1BF
MMAKWVDMGGKIENDWYQVRCQIDQDMNLKIYLDGLKNQENHFCIDFDKILFCKVIDEGWDLNPCEYWDDPKNIPMIHKAILVELLDSHIKRIIRENHQAPFRHYQILGINFGIDVISGSQPIINKLKEN